MFSKQARKTHPVILVFDQITQRNLQKLLELGTLLGISIGYQGLKPTLEHPWAPSFLIPPLKKWEKGDGDDDDKEWTLLKGDLVIDQIIIQTTTLLLLYPQIKRMTQNLARKTTIISLWDKWCIKQWIELECIKPSAKILKWTGSMVFISKSEVNINNYEISLDIADVKALEMFTFAQLLKQIITEILYVKKSPLNKVILNFAKKCRIFSRLNKNMIHGRRH